MRKCPILCQHALDGSTKGRLLRLGIGHSIEVLNREVGAHPIPGLPVFDIFSDTDYLPGHIGTRYEVRTRTIDPKHYYKQGNQEVNSRDWVCLSGDREVTKLLQSVSVSLGRTLVVYLEGYSVNFDKNLIGLRFGYWSLADGQVLVRPELNSALASELITGRQTRLGEIPFA